ncbi:hypothetical protein [Streptomyces sp. NPDC031705]|uniref:hypothetical protein n=1 Tax=unclassified Streptomyces TaxID=2593676 RepID=UPI0033DB0AD2
MERPSPRDTAAGLARLEGYLMSRAALHEAQTQAEALARRLTWLGRAEQEEVARMVAAHHLRLHKDAMTAIVTRSRELEAEYEARYGTLRNRLLFFWLVLAPLAAGSVLALLLTRP